MSIETIFKNIELKKRIKFANIKLNILRNSKNSLPEICFESQIAIESNEIIPMEIVQKSNEIEYNKFPHKLRYKYLSMCNLNTDNQTQHNKLLPTTNLEESFFQGNIKKQSEADVLALDGMPFF
jgi:hypothetical protein